MAIPRMPAPQSDPLAPKTGPAPDNEVGTTATMGKPKRPITTSAPPPVPQQPPTFAQAQAAGLPRPAPVPGMPIPGGGPVGGMPITQGPGQIGMLGGGGDLRSQVMAGLQALMQNPGAAPGTLEAEYTRGAEDIDDQFALNQKYLKDELSSRGLGNVEDGTIGLGRMSDLNIGQRGAKTDLLSRLSIEAQKAAGDDLRAALGLAAGYDTDIEGNQIARESNQLRAAEMAAQREFDEKRLEVEREFEAGRISQQEKDRELMKYRTDLDEKLGRDRLALDREDTEWDNVLAFLREIYGQDFLGPDKEEAPTPTAGMTPQQYRDRVKKVGPMTAGF